MDFRVTHFLVAASGQTAVSTDSLSALGNGEIAAYSTTTDSTTGTSIDGSAVATGKIYFAQGLDRTDAIQKELGLIKSGVIDMSKIISVRKLVGTDDYTRQVKFFGAAANSRVVKTYVDGTAYLSGDIIYKASTGLWQVVEAGTADTTDPSDVTGAVVDMGTARVASILGSTVAASTQYSKFAPTAADGSTTVGTLEVQSDKEYTFSVRARSAKANSISPFGITRGYSAMASSTFINTTSGASATSESYSPFSVAFGLVKNFSTDTMLADFAKVGAVLSVHNQTDSSTFIFGYSDLSNTITGTTGVSITVGSNLPTFLGTPSAVGNGGLYFIDVRQFTTWNEALTAIVGEGTYSNPYPAYSSTVIPGKHYTFTLYTEALEQITWKNNYDITAFPYKWDIVRLNGFFHEGPYGKVYDWYTTGAINAGVSTQTPITFDKTQSGLITAGTIAINPVVETTNPIPVGYAVMTAAGAAKTEPQFPNLLKEEVRHIAHQYQSYPSKYKQQFHGVKYNAMVMDPQQAKIDYDGPYTLYYIEYLPVADTSYTSTQPMTNLTIIAVPSTTSSSGIIEDIDKILTGANITTAAAGLETAG